MQKNSVTWIFKGAPDRELWATIAEAAGQCIFQEFECGAVSKSLGWSTSVR